ncbi:MAG: hypothetical protein V4795_00095 [Pseudomonadota bacterium]
MKTSWRNMCESFWGSPIRRPATVRVFGILRRLRTSMAACTGPAGRPRGAARRQNRLLQATGHRDRPQDPQIHNLRSPKTLRLGGQASHIHSRRSPKTLREIPISTAHFDGKLLSHNGFSGHQSFKSSSVQAQAFKAHHVTSFFLIVN